MKGIPLSAIPTPPPYPSSKIPAKLLIGKSKYVA